jgi:hypothetical protein
MSISLIIKALEANGALVPYEPFVKRPPHPQGPRYLWLTPTTFDWCFPEGSHPDARIGDASLANLADQMNAFVWGQFMEVGIDIKRLNPHDKDIWEVRSHLKKPQLRVFGWCALPKLFVATNYANRDDLEPSNGPKWNVAIDQADRFRTALVGLVDFFHANPSEYVKNPT